MKRVLAALAMTLGASFQAQAHGIATPVWGCNLKGVIDGTQQQLELILIRGEEVTGHGTVVCRDGLGHTAKRAVNIHIVSGGVGPAINGPLQGLNIVAAVAGLAQVDGMIGQYELSVGPRLGLINSRMNVMAGTQVGGYGVGANIEAVIEYRSSIGLDIGGMTLTLTPAN